MTVVSSYEAQFKASGVSETVKGFTDVQKAAALADRQQKVNAQNLRDYAKAQIQTENEIARAAQRTAAAQAKAADKVKYSIAPGLTSAADAAKNFISQNALLIGGLTAVGAAGVKAYQSFQAYAGSVRDVALASGTTATEASVLLQVLDDYEITAQDVMVATKAMTKNGLEPSLDTLAKLSDEYVKIQDPMQKNEFILKNLGKAGLQWANALNQGGAALRASSSEINKYLILSDEQIKKAEQSRLAIDTLNDSWEGMKVAVGGAIGDAIVLNQQMTDYQSVTGQSATQLGVLTEGFKQYQKESEKGALMTEYAKRMFDALNPSMEANGAEADALAEKQKALEASSRQYMSTLQTISSETEKFTENNQQLNDTLADLESQLASETVGSDKYVELTGKIGETKDAITQLADEHAQASKRIIFDLISQQAAAEGFKNISVDALAALGEQWGVLAEGSAAATTAAISQAEAWASALEQPAEGIKTIAEMWANLADLAKTGVTLTAKVVSQATGGAYGGQNTAGACFTGDTPVTMADGHTKPIQDVMVGDIVLSYDLTHKLQIHTCVVEKFIHPKEEGGRLLLFNGHLKVTEEHLIWNGFVWIAAGLFRVGDLLMNQDGSFDAIRSIRELVKDEVTYNLHVDNNVHNYFAGGILVHNAKAQSNAGGGMLGGGWNLVGDTPGGGFIPGVSELIHNGKVYSSKESAALIRSGRVGVAKSFAQPTEDVYTNFTKPSGGGGSTVTTSTTTSKAKNGGVQQSGGGGGSAVNQTIQINKQAAEMQVQTQAIANNAQVQITNMMAQLQASQQMAQSVFEDMLSVLKNENPRAIGKQVAYELAKSS